MKPPKPNLYFKVIGLSGAWTDQVGKLIKTISREECGLSHPSCMKSGYDVLAFAILSQSTGAYIEDKPRFNFIYDKDNGHDDIAVQHFYEMVICEKHLIGLDAAGVILAKHRAIQIAIDAIESAIK